MQQQYYDIICRGTEHEDMLVILQFLKGMVGNQFSFLNYYKEIPVSYDATLLNVDHEMAEFSVHEYQAKAIGLDHCTLIRAHAKSSVKDDLIAEAFYVDSHKNRVVLCKFGYVTIRSDKRRYVRVQTDHPVLVEIVLPNGIQKGNVRNISLGGAAMSVMSSDMLEPGSEVKMIIKLPDLVTNTLTMVEVAATVIGVKGESSPFLSIIEFSTDQKSQQLIAHYINQRQIEIIRSLKYIVA
ncbi:MAG TPA: PilZ domain-containing protein [Desulfuromonadales bacterium]|nr:PilZ domain-containing protein [Desulfuromonadales bacterium]